MVRLVGRWRSLTRWSIFIAIFLCLNTIDIVLWAFARRVLCLGVVAYGLLNPVSAFLLGLKTQCLSKETNDSESLWKFNGKKRLKKPEGYIPKCKLFPRRRSTPSNGKILLQFGRFYHRFPRNEGFSGNRYGLDCCAFYCLHFQAVRIDHIQKPKRCQQLRTFRVWKKEQKQFVKDL